MCRSCLSDDPSRAFCAYLPDYLLKRLSRSDDAGVRDVAYESAKAQAAFGVARNLGGTGLRGIMGSHGGKSRLVHDMRNEEDPLPGDLIRREGEIDLPSDPDANAAYDHSGIVYDFYQAVFGRNSLDGRGMPLMSSVRYGRGPANAFWDGTQMIYGESDGVLFLPLVRSLSAVAHEFTHGVVAHASGLDYFGETGALNESFCDVMGELTVQWHRNLDVSQAAWSCGEDVVGDYLTQGNVLALRTFTSAPAFSGSIMGDDPQPKHMFKYVSTPEDRGGVHINSGIPNHAFYLAAQAMGGHAWRDAGRIWYEALLTLRRDARFEDAAAATIAKAEFIFGRESTQSAAVRAAWMEVGVI